uniref:Uncharacterized protein n=1 Tax=Meloidogyne hapla TaxID=6305 RepID=A0A1I8B4G9_MELHA
MDANLMNKNLKDFEKEIELIIRNTESVKKPLMYNRSFKEIKNDHYNVPHYNVPHGSSSSKHPDMDQGGHGEFEDWYPVDFNKN